MRQHLITVLAVLATLALVCCGAPSTPDFVKRAASSDLYEVAAGRMASERGQSAAVKQFGEHMVEAHGKTTEELKRIVEDEKLKVKLPAEPEAKQQNMLKALSEAKPEEFDAVYLRQQMAAHQRAAELFDKYAERGENDALKQFAANMLPAIKQHLEAVEKLMR